MERGQLAEWSGAVTLFVFEDLLATCGAPHRESAMVKAQRWDRALSYWEFDAKVLDHLYDLMARYAATVEVATWHPPGFAPVLKEHIWGLGVPISDTFSALSYASLSQHIATDPRVTTVYDPDPSHRFGYGFKAREFAAGQM